MLTPDESESRNVPGLIALITRAAQGDAASLADCAFYFDMLQCEAGLTEFPSAVLEVLITLLQDARFLADKNAWKILTLLENGWDLTTDQQRGTLLGAIEVAYPRLQHWMGPFFLSELLGDSYCDEPAFAVICRLYDTSAETARQFIPHALQHIAKSGKTQSLREEALAKLRWIAATATGIVKEEASSALAACTAP